MCHFVTQMCHFVTHCITTSLSRRSTISFSLWGCMVLPTRASLFLWIRKRATAPSRPGRDRETGAHWYRGWRQAHRQRHTQLPHMNTINHIHMYIRTTHGHTQTHTPHTVMIKSTEPDKRVWHAGSKIVYVRVRNYIWQRAMKRCEIVCTAHTVRTYVHAYIHIHICT